MSTPKLWSANRLRRWPQAGTKSSEPEQDLRFFLELDQRRQTLLDRRPVELPLLTAHYALDIYAVLGPVGETLEHHQVFGRAGDQRGIGQKAERRGSRDDVLLEP